MAIQIKITDQQKHVIKAIADAGGQPFFVGGIVRDAFIGRDSKDVDIEVFNIEFGPMVEAIKKVDCVKSITVDAGKRFPVTKVRCQDDTEMDVASPRREVFVGGEAEFEVQADPWMPKKEAAARRDFTMNAIMVNGVTGEVFDFFGGINDIAQGVIRHTSSQFAEDPDRVIRAGRFAAQINMNIDPETFDICQTMVASPIMETVNAEQINAEFKKIFKSKNPSVAFRFFAKVGWIQKRFPEIANMINCPQDPRWHPEGDVFEHTMQVMDRMAEIAIQEQWDDNKKIQMVMAAMCHDMGKPSTTVTESNGSITSKGHAQVGVPIAEAFMRRCKFDNADFINRVCIMVDQHMAHSGMEATQRTTRRVAARIAPVSIVEWAAIIKADASGRDCGWFDPAAEFVKIAAEQSIDKEGPKPIVMGRHVIPFGIKGPAVGAITKAAFEAQIEGNIKTIEDGQAFIQNWIKNNPK